MKKQVCVWVLSLCCLALALPASAQLHFGVKGGLNMAKLDTKHWKSDNTTGFFIGPMAEVTIPVIGLGVDAAVMYSQRGDSFEVLGEKFNFKQQGLEIPVNLKYTLGLGSMLGVFVSAGPDFFFNFKDLKVDGFKKKNSQVGLNLGAGLKLLRHLQVGFNYQIPLGDSFTLDKAVEGAKDLGDMKYKTWQVSLAYLF